MSNPHIAPVLECLDPENDFFWVNSDLANIGARIEAQAQATLALAYEQRTANLLKALSLSQGTARALRLTAEIETRLGLGETK